MSLLKQIISRENLNRIRRSIAVGIALTLSINASLAFAQKSVPLEYEVKAGYLYNFARFVEWPVEKTESEKIVIGVLGTPHLAEIFREKLQTETLNGKPIVVQSYSSPSEVRSCHILYVGKTFQSQYEQIIHHLKGSDTLTVGESAQFIPRGGMVNFVIEENKVLFAINLPAVQESRLKVSSQMLQYARIVR